ncbi:MAG: heavy-metal-associated domain-containing protein [Gemmatimonadaceae bacterium]
MKNPLLTLLGAGAAAAFAICDPCQPSAPARGIAPLAVAAEPAVLVRAVALDPRIVTLRVEGMTCGGCAIAARKVLRQLVGVKNAEVSYETRRAVVTYDPEKVTVEQMVAVLKKKLGYVATVVDG